MNALRYIWEQTAVLVLAIHLSKLEVMKGRGRTKTVVGTCSPVGGQASTILTRIFVVCRFALAPTPPQCCGWPPRLHSFVALSRTLNIIRSSTASGGTQTQKQMSHLCEPPQSIIFRRMFGISTGQLSVGAPSMLRRRVWENRLGPGFLPQH